MNASTPLLEKPVSTSSLDSCIHCGFCLGSCPTYQLTGDENNSPRGRLAHWKALAEGRLQPNAKVDFYMDECVGCLACETACPAQVPYGSILHDILRQRVAEGKSVPWWLRLVADAVGRPDLFHLALLPLRLLRKSGWPGSKFIFPGRPSIFKSSSEYAREVMDRVKPTGPRVALLSGCLMEAAFREINFATIRVLAANNIQVTVPEGQTCCGAFLEHTGIAGLDKLQQTNRSAFDSLDVDAIVTNSAGCGLTLQYSLQTPVVDVTKLLAEVGCRAGHGVAADHIYVDLPCHLVHGQKEPGIPTAVLDAIGTPWSLAPMATECCGSGGVYNQLKPDNAREILRRKSAFLDESPHKCVILTTSNHVCLMQWHSARRQNLVRRPYRVAHVIQLLDESLSSNPNPNLSHSL